MPQLVNDFGFATTFQILAGLQAVPVLCGIVIKFIPSPNEVGQSNMGNERQTTGFDWSLFKKIDYMTLVAALCLFMLAYVVPLVHLVS